MNEPVYVKDLFEDDFFDNWLVYITKERELNKEYKRYLSEIKKSLESWPEPQKHPRLKLSFSYVE